MGCRVLGIVRWSYSSRVIRFGFVGWGGFHFAGGIERVVCWEGSLCGGHVCFLFFAISRGGLRG